MTVYVPQEPTRYVNGEQEPMFDLTPASEYGDINILLNSGQVMLNTAPMIQKLRTEMREYSDEDYILAIGDPSALAAVVAVAAMYNNGKFKLLKVLLLNLHTLLLTPLIRSYRSCKFLWIFCVFHHSFQYHTFYLN